MLADLSAKGEWAECPECRILSSQPNKITLIIAYIDGAL